MPAALVVVPALVRQSADPDAAAEERNLRLQMRPRVAVLVTQRTMVVQRRRRRRRQQQQPGLVVMATAARSWIRVVCFCMMMLLSSLPLVSTLAWAPPPSVLVSRRSYSLPLGLHHRPPHPVVWFPLHAAANNDNNDNNEEEKKEEDSDQDLWMNIPPPSASSSSQQEDKPAQQQQQQRKLGIDIGAQLAPMTPQEAAELSAAAQEIVNDAVAAGLDEIDALRAQMKQELQQSRAASAQTSAANAQRASAQLLNRIDALTESFLQSTQSERTATQRAAAADQASAAGQGLEVGVWGTVGGVAVPTTASSGAGEAALLLGSVAASSTRSTDIAATDSPMPRLLILADPDADPYARALVPAVTETLQQVLFESNPTLTVELYKPTATVPLGGNNAAAVVLFCTSFSDRSTVAQTLERVLRRTVSSTTGQVGTPPSHIVAISTVGTAQTHKMPYSLQNLFTGGALEKRKQMEETIVRIVRDRQQQPPLDYTICKLGELRPCTTEFVLRPGEDEMEGTATTTFLDPTTAATVVTQALALQPFARNATFSCVGRLPLSSSGSSSTSDNNINNEQQAILDDAFLRLDGPELLRMDLESATEEAHFGALVEYLREWAHLLAGSRGLTTPIQAQDVVVTTSRTRCPTVVRRQQTAVRVLFLPTNTGNKYRSKDEERERERESGNLGGVNVTSRRSTVAKEGGVEFVVEVTTDNRMRVRVKRCNYGDDAVIKELSEKTILSRFRQSMEVWKKDHQQ